MKEGEVKTIAEYCNKYGRVAALVACGHNELAAALEEAERVQMEIIEREGAMRFADRPKETQKALRQTGVISQKADDVIWEFRKRALAWE